MEQRRVRTSAENVVQRETSSLSRTYYMRIKREREKGEDSRFVVMQDAKGDERCPPPQSSIPFSFPFQMASRRTSFPRLTASRHAEGNENNEIQRSSVTYARRAPPLNSHLYYLSGSKSIHPSPPLPLPAVSAVVVRIYVSCRNNGPTREGNLYPQWDCAPLRTLPY